MSFHLPRNINLSTPAQIDELRARARDCGYVNDVQICAMLSRVLQREITELRPEWLYAYEVEQVFAWLTGETRRDGLVVSLDDVLRVETMLGSHVAPLDEPGREVLQDCDPGPEL